MACSENKNPLKRGATSQNQRLLDGLKPGYVNVEERDEADRIVFASKFSTFLNYYNNSNRADGNWETFFNNNTAAVLASIAVQNLDDYRLEIKSRFDTLKSNDLPLNLKKETLSTLFAATLTFAKALDQILSKLTNDDDFKTGVLNLIKSKLQPALQKLLAYYKGA